jgi:hypothetical protein
MDDELVLLTSYFNLVDGRRQDTADTFRVDTDLPSTSSPDGSSALYIVTESSTAGHMGPRSRRLAADTIAWEYSSHGDNPPAVRLKSALRTAHEEVLREFEGHVVVGATVMAVERDTVYLAQVAPSQVYVLHNGSLHSIPAASNGDSPFAHALGGRSAPKISVFRDEIAQGDVIGLCSSWFDTSTDPSDLRECFGAGTSDEIAEALLDLAQRDAVRDATAIVIEAALSGELEVVATGDEAPGFMEQVDIAVRALASVGRMIWSELQPVSANGHADQGENAPEPARARAGSVSDTAEVPLVSADDTGPEEEPRRAAESEPTEPDLAQEVPTVIADPAAVSEVAPLEAEKEVPQEPAAPPERPSRIPVEEITQEVPRVPPPGPRPPMRRPSRTRQPKAEPPPQPKPDPAQSELDQVNSRLHDGPDMEDVIPPVQAFEDTSTEPARIYATSKNVEAANRRPRRFGGTPSVPVIRPGLGDIDLRQPIVRPTPSALVWGSLAVLLVLAVLAGYLAYKRLANRGPHSNPYMALVLTDLTKARTGKTAADQDYYLNRAKQNITLAQANGAPAKWVASHRAELQSTSDTLHHITRESTAALLTDFSKFPGANPTGIATAPGLVYVVDPSRKALFSVATTPGANPTEIAQAGDVYSGFTVSVPQLVAVDGTTALMLDDKDVLVRASGGVKTATSLPQQTAKAGHFVAMATSDPDVYLLDTANSQVWRYPYAVTSYNPTQAAYWDTNPPPLGDGVSLAFGRAELYVMRSNGAILKFDFQANPQKFAVNLKTPFHNPVAMYTDPNQKWIWIADPANKRIVQLDQNGGYSRTYVSSTSAMDFSRIRSISVGPGGNTIYVLDGSKLFDFPVVS